MKKGGQPPPYLYMDTDQQAYDLIDPPKKLIVQFYDKPVVSGEVNGVPVYQPRLMMQKAIKGENSSLSKVATENHKHEHPKEFELYQKRVHLNLTPLSALTDPMTAMSLNDQGVFTLEDLAASEPLKLFNELREKARLILEIKNDTKESQAEKITCTNRQEHNNNHDNRNDIEESDQAREASKRHDSGGPEHNYNKEVMNYSWSM